MSQREKILAAAVLALIGMFGMRYLYGRYEQAAEAREKQLTAAYDTLSNLQLELREGERALQQMEKWRQQSVPASREKALSMYKSWLLATAMKAGLAVDDIVPAPQVAQPSTDVRAIGYRMQASGSLSSVIGLLYEFYRSPLLHQVTRLQVTRPMGGTNLQVMFEAEALLLPGANATDALPEGESNRLQLASLSEYQKSLGDRDLASVYMPPRPPAPVVRRETTEPPKFDDSEQAYFTGSVNLGGQSQAWINVRTTGETLFLSAGDPLKIGALEGKILSIEPRAIVWENGEKKFRVALGESLRKGKELPGEGTSTKAEADEVEQSDS